MKFLPTKDNIMSLDTMSKTLSANRQGRVYVSDYDLEYFINYYTTEHGNSVIENQDPIYTGFKMFFHFDAPNGLFADETYQNSALAYLKRIGQTQRYNLLKRFINTLSEINSLTPYVFQSIDGISELWTQPFSDVLTNKQINIQTLEMIDMRLASLTVMYRTIVFDNERKCYVVPENLRKFSMSVYIHDMRVFNELDKNNARFLKTESNQDVTKLNHIMFDLGYCEFNINSGAEFLSTVSRNNNEANINNLTIDFEQYDISGLFRTITGDNNLNALEMSLSDIVNIGKVSEENRFKREFTDFVGENVDYVDDRLSELLDFDRWKTNLSDIVLQGESRLIDLAQSRLTRLYLGNVYEFSIDDILNLNRGLNINENLGNINGIL